MNYTTIQLWLLVSYVYVYYFSDGIMIGFHLTSFWYIEKNTRKSEMQDQKMITKIPDK